MRSAVRRASIAQTFSLGCEGLLGTWGDKGTKSAVHFVLWFGRQEFFVIPSGAESFGEAMQIGCEVQAAPWRLESPRARAEHMP